MKWTKELLKQIPSLQNGHKLPVSRRDFVAHGLMAGGASMIGPSMLGMMSRVAQAQSMGIQCAEEAMEAGGSSKIPVLIFDLAGGPNFAGSNIIVGSQGQSNLFTNYSRFGLTSAPSANQIDSRYGLKFFNQSGILEGIDTVLRADADIQSKIDGVIFSSVSLDDRASNPHNPAYLLARAGAGGSLTTLVGSDDSNSGGRSQPANGSFDPALKPVVISNRQSALNLVEPGRLARLLNGNLNNVRRVMQAASRMSSSATRRFASQDLNQQIKDLVNCGYLKAEELMGQDRLALVNPDLNPGTRATDVFNNQGPFTNAAGANVDVTINAGEVERTRTMTHLLLGGFAGVATVQLGGYDYHGNARATTDARDRHLGRLIGQAFAAAKMRNKSLAIYVYTDGAVSSAGGNPNGMKTQFSSDAGDYSASFMMVYHHNGSERPGGILSTDRQVGGYTQNGANPGAEKGSAVTGNVTALSQALVLNYLALHGQESRINEVVGSNPFNSSNFNEYIAFKKIS